MNIPHFKTVGEYRAHQNKLRKASAEDQIIIQRFPHDPAVAKARGARINQRYAEDIAIEQFLRDQQNAR